ARAGVESGGPLGRAGASAIDGVRRGGAAGAGRRAAARGGAVYADRRVDQPFAGFAAFRRLGGAAGAAAGLAPAWLTGVAAGGGLRGVGLRLVAVPGGVAGRASGRCRRL